MSVTAFNRRRREMAKVEKAEKAEAPRVEVPKPKAATKSKK